MPPCLEALMRNGMPEGGRNNGLLCFGVYYRKAFPNDWEARVRHHNEQHCKPPLEKQELEGTVLKSLEKKKYSYLCEQEPVSSRCDRQACLKRVYGINHRTSQEKGAYDDLTLGNLRKFNTTPPRYRLEVNGQDLEMASEELRNYATGFRAVVFDRLNLVVPPIKQDKWDQQLRELLLSITVIEVPDDASQNGVILAKVEEFLNLAERTRAKEDVLKGLPWHNATATWFRAPDLQKFLANSKLAVEPHKLYMLLEGAGATYEDVTLKGRKVSLWSYPDHEGRKQTEPFAAPKVEVHEEGPGL
jgi:hypothetical protein